MKKDENPISTQLEMKLKELFGEEEAGVDELDDAAEPLDEVDFIVEGNVLTQLKSLVYSIDWEIKDAYLIDLISEAERLQQEFIDDKYIQILFKMMTSITNHILKRKAEAHPNSIPLLKDIYEGIEKLVLGENLSEREKKTEVSDLLNRFNQLKEAVKAKAEAKEEKDVEVLREKGPEPFIGEAAQEEQKEVEKAQDRGVTTGDSTQGISRDPYEAFLYALEELKEVIRAEMGAIRAELRVWRESLK